MTHLRIAAPTADTPGFLKWSGELVDIMDTVGDGAVTPERSLDLMRAMSRLRNVLVHFVVEPADPDEAAAALEELSLNQLMECLNGISGAMAGAGPSPKVGPPSGDGFAGNKSPLPYQPSSSRRRKHGTPHPG